MGMVERGSETLPISENVLVGESTFLEGELGVIATEDFDPDELIFIVAGPIISQRTRHSFQVGVNEHIDPQKDGKPGLGYYTNHWCHNPSAYVEVVSDNGDGYVKIIARTKIQKGEEITVDYATLEYETTVSNLPCKCGSAQCRGHIKGHKDLSQEEITEMQSKGLIPAYLLELDGSDSRLRR